MASIHLDTVSSRTTHVKDTQQHEVLKTLQNRCEPLSRLEIANDTRLTKSVVIGRLNELVEMGAVECIEDRRGKLLEYRYALPDSNNPLQIRHLRGGGYSLRCPGCGKRRRLKHYRDAYLLECKCGQHGRYEARELNPQ
jgi:hypothetical protein